MALFTVTKSVAIRALHWEASCGNLFLGLTSHHRLCQCNRIGHRWCRAVLGIDRLQSQLVHHRSRHHRSLPTGWLIGESIGKAGRVW